MVFCGRQDEISLHRMFGRYGEVESSSVRHKVDAGGNNHSWALVTATPARIDRPPLSCHCNPGVHLQY